MTDEHTVAIVSFAGALKREIKRVRRKLQRDERMSEFSIEIDVKGRVHDGDVKLTYSVCPSSWQNSDAVKGDDLDACVEELMRRRGWQSVHAPVAIGYERVPSDDTEGAVT